MSFSSAITYNEWFIKEMLEYLKKWTFCLELRIQQSIWKG